MGSSERAGTEGAFGVYRMKGLQRLVRRSRGKKKVEGLVLGVNQSGGWKLISRQCLASALSLVLSTFGALSDASSWKKKMSEEPHALGLAKHGV